MDKQKQIEEMAKVIHDLILDTPFNGTEASCEKIAEELLKHYQPKIPEGAVVLTREEKQEYESLIKLLIYDKPIKSRIYEFIKDIKNRIRKETAEKFARLAKQKINEVISDIILSRPPTNDDESEVVRKQVLSAITSPLKKIRDEKIDEIAKEITGLVK